MWIGENALVAILEPYRQAGNGTETRPAPPSAVGMFVQRYRRAMRSSADIGPDLEAEVRPTEPSARRIRRDETDDSPT